MMLSGKSTFPTDFVILEMEEDNKVPLILGQPFLHTADAVIRVKQKQLNLGVRTERMIFNIDSAMKHSYSMMIHVLVSMFIEDIFEIAWVCSPGDLRSRLNVLRFQGETVIGFRTWVSISVCLMIMKQQQEDYYSRLRDILRFEKLKQEKDNIDFKIEKFDKATKDLDQLLGSQITDKSKKGFGYCAVPPPHPLIYNRPNKLDLSYSGLDKFKRAKPHMIKVFKTANLDFEDVYFVNELKFNLFSVSQMCDKKNYVLFTDTECLVLSPNFKLPDENQILLKVPRKDNMYSFDMKNIVPKESLTCLVAKATLDESMLWHRRLGHINFKNINKLVKDNLVRGLPTKRFENDQTCVACLKGKQHRASCKSKVLNPITKPLFMLHIDLFGPTFVSSLMHKKYCLVVTDDYSRFTWVFFLTTKDETSEILKRFIKEIENLVDKKVKIIRSDNGTEFKNKVMDDFCREKGIKREYSVARTPQQNGVAERRNRTLIEAARTMLADSLRLLEHCYVHEA
ncbi:putative ribonuclease H-like domain-containing protein [Tanacetum coccineum]